MKPAALLCFLPAFLSHTTAAFTGSPQWLDQQRQIIRDRKLSNKLETLQPRDNALLEGSILRFDDERAEAYRIKEPLPDIDGSWTPWYFICIFSLFRVSRHRT
jgi:hypothetical protein